MSVRKPPLFGVHEERGASFTDFGGWQMPVEFDSIRTEHEAVREAVGIFDVSHMGEIVVTGPDARELMNRLTTNDVAELAVGDSQYAAIVDEAGTMLDDTIIYRLPDEDGTPSYLFVPNAGHDEGAYDRWIDHRDAWGLEATVENRTGECAMFAVQGPDSPSLVADALDGPGTDVDRFTATHVTVSGVECWMGRTGYTGEDGYEFVLPWEEAETVWSAFDCQPCGLGARDTLRLEGGFLLGGNEFDYESNPRTPIEAGIEFAVDLETEFVGRDALAAIAAEGPEERLVGFELLERGIPRTGYDVATPDGETIGTVTSGTMSPTLGKPIGLAYVPAAYAEPGTELAVVVRGEPKEARVEATPFIDIA